MQDIATYTGCYFAGCIHGSAALTENPLEKGYLPPGDLKEADKLLEKAYSLGQSLARTSHEPAWLDQVA